MERNRRQLLTGIGTGSITLLAGCLSGGSSSESSGDGGILNGSEGSSFTPTATNRLFGSAMFRPHVPDADTPSSPSDLDRESATDVSMGGFVQNEDEGVLIADEGIIYRIFGNSLSRFSNDSSWETDLTGDRLRPTVTPHFHNGSFYFIEDDAIRTVDADTGEITNAFRPDNSRITDRLRESTFANGMLYTPVGTETEDSFSIIVYDPEQKEITNTISSFGIDNYDSEDATVNSNSPIIDNNGRIYLPIFKDTGLISDRRMVIGDLETGERISRIPYSNTAENLIFRGNYLLYTESGFQSRTLFVTNLETGEEVLSTSDIDVTTTVADNNQLYMGLSGSTEVVAYDLETGEEAWRDILVNEPNSEMVVANGVLYLATKSNKILSYDTETGEKLFEHSVQMDSDEFKELLVTNGELYVKNGSDIFRYNVE